MGGVVEDFDSRVN